MTRDEDDWVGEPPEGKVSRERSNPGFWGMQWQARLATAMLGIVIVVGVLIVVLLG